MANVDFHAQYESYVQISITDLNGKFGACFTAEHPDQHRYPGVSMATCQLAAGQHDIGKVTLDTLPETWAQGGFLTRCLTGYNRNGAAAFVVGWRP